MVAFVVEALDEVMLDIAGPEGRLAGHDLMSPYVWLEGESRHRMLVRVLPNPLGPTDPTGVIWAGDSADGLNFVMRKEPSIVPGPEPVDAGGCEDPSMVCNERGEYLIFYTGVDAARQQGSMLVAAGPHLVELKKQKVMLEAPKGEGNIKEATLAKGSDGQYRLFYEYAKDNASRVGMAVGPGLEGPWTVVEDPFPIREGAWDNWHLSTGPMLEQPGKNPVMFYNGATVDARWRIGWIEFSPDYAKVTARGVEPLLMPPPAKDRTATDIAFAASVVIKRDGIWLYYSLEDRVLRRATVTRYG
jgi:predicted GH43/DUF377 family glycosyl hydrolase